MESARLALAPADFSADRITYSSDLDVRASGTDKLVGEQVGPVS